VVVVSQHPVPVIPASYFGMVLGLSGLGNAWRVAHQVWNLPAVVGEVLMAAAALVWSVLVILYALKWIFAHEAAHDELHHPVNCCFVGLVGVATMLIAGAALPYSRFSAEVLFIIGVAWTLAFAVWRTGGLWQGERDPGTTTAVLYLPTVAGSFVAATVAAALGYPDWGQLAFGAGLFSWLAIESVLMHRLYTVAELPAALRPTLGIQLAPPTVGAVAYASVMSGPPDVLAHGLIGYGLLQALVLLRLLPWIMRQPFSLSYWAFTFGLSALATAPLRLIDRFDTDVVAVLAPPLFVGANVAIGLIVVGSLRLALQSRVWPASIATARSSR
jgi:tellurite resistance protein